MDHRCGEAKYVNGHRMDCQHEMGHKGPCEYMPIRADAAPFAWQDRWRTLYTSWDQVK